MWTISQRHFRGLRPFDSKRRGLSIEIIDYCPNCENKLESIPKRKAKCPNWDEQIYVKTKKNIFDKNLLTQEEKLAAEEMYKLKGQFGVEFSNYRIKEKELTQKFGKVAPPGDIIWGLYSDLILEHVSNYWSLHLIYYDQAQFLFKEGRNSFPIMKLSLEMNLLALKSEGIENVKVHTDRIDYPELCRKLNGMTLPINEALSTMPIPIKECSQLFYDENRNFCRCPYMPVYKTVKENENKTYKIKRPIKKKKPLFRKK
jgi:hypothetical protein